MSRALHRALIQTALKPNGQGWAHDMQCRTLFSTLRSVLAIRGDLNKSSLVLRLSTPPELLYHCIESQSANAVVADGLRPGRCRQVHLTSDAVAALQIGSRISKPVVLRVQAARMHSDCHLFFQADDSVWFTEHVPATYLDFDAIGGFASGPAR